MRWLALLHAWLNAVSKRPGWKLKKTIALHFGFPVFNVCYLFFKLTHFFGERRLLLLASQVSSERIRELLLHGVDSSKHLAVVGQRVGSLDQLGQGLGALNGGNNLGVHDLTPNLN